MVDVTKTRRDASRWVKSILHGLWPSSCVLCSARGATPALDLCAACRADLPLNEPACALCAQLLARADSEPGASLVCGACLRRPPRFDAAVCALRYAYPVDHLVRALKYRSAIVQGRVLGELLASHIQLRHTEGLPGLLIPVPLAQQRFATRGYNQAIEVGRRLEKRLRVPLRTDLMVRCRETAEQAGLKKRQRTANVRGAFVLQGTLPARHVAIIDDVMTTGSTVNELARVLKRAGAGRVEVWAVARAGKQG